MKKIGKVVEVFIPNENDIDIRIIQSMLGHSSLASTEIYAHVSNKKLKEFMQNFSILDIKK